MSHRHVIVLTCDKRTEGQRCRAWYLGPSSTSLPDVRTAAADSGWSFHPGVPYPHVDGTDTCPDHSKET